jgi:hypothetical protein
MTLESWVDRASYPESFFELTYDPAQWELLQCDGLELTHQVVPYCRIWQVIPRGYPQEPWSAEKEEARTQNGINIETAAYLYQKEAMYFVYYMSDTLSPSAATIFGVDAVDGCREEAEKVLSTLRFAENAQVTTGNTQGECSPGWREALYAPLMLTSTTP